MRVTLTITLLLFLFQSVNAQTTAIPDSNFEQILIDLGYDNGPIDGLVQTANINSVDSLNLFASYISDLTGIEDFIALIYLNCGFNELTSINITQNTALTYFDCHLNDLTSIDVTQNTALTHFYCNHTQISSLDVSQNTSLIGFNCSFNQITNLDVTMHPALSVFYCNDNQITSLDVSQNANLTNVLLGYNEITSLDFSQNTSLITLQCNNNNLTCLNLQNGNNSTMWLNATNNPNLDCIAVDDPIWSTNNWSIDNWTSFSSICSNPCTVSLVKNESLANQIKAYPNPTSGLVAVELNKVSSNVEATLFNSLGQIVFSKKYENSNQISFEINSQKGLYFLQLISSSQKTEMIKIIKE